MQQKDEQSLSSSLWLLLGSFQLPTPGKIILLDVFYTPTPQLCREVFSCWNTQHKNATCNTFHPSDSLHPFERVEVMSTKCNSKIAVWIEERVNQEQRSKKRSRTELQEIKREEVYRGRARAEIKPFDRLLTHASHCIIETQNHVPGSTVVTEEKTSVHKRLRAGICWHGNTVVCYCWRTWSSCRADAES